MKTNFKFKKQLIAFAYVLLVVVLFITYNNLFSKYESRQYESRQYDVVIKKNMLKTKALIIMVHL